MAAPVNRPFTKPAKTYTDQVNLLQSRGMVIPDRGKAEFYLKQLNYYRLGAYWLPFEDNHSTHTFKNGTHFDDVLNLYIFDRELRLIMLDAIERIEVSIRSHWAYHIANKHGPHAHLDSSLAHDINYWRKNLAAMTKEVKRSKERFIKHLMITYSERLPPIWAVSEVISLGVLSRCYKNFGEASTRSLISNNYHIDQGTLDSWLEHFTVVRNICAHHSRLWNREFTVTAKIPRTKPKTLAAQLHPASRKIYNTFVIALHLMDVISPRHHWRTKLKDFLNANPIALAHMDFPANWNSMPIWNDPP